MNDLQNKTHQEQLQQEVTEKKENKIKDQLIITTNNFFDELKQKLPLLSNIYLVIIVQILLTLFVLHTCIQKNNLSKLVLWKGYYYTIFFAINVLFFYIPVADEFKILFLIISSLVQGGFFYTLANNIIIPKINLLSFFQQCFTSAIIIYLGFALISFAMINLNIQLSFEMLFGGLTIFTVIVVSIIGKRIPSVSFYQYLLLLSVILIFSYYVLYNTNRVLVEDVTNPFDGAVRFYINFLNIMIQIFLTVFYYRKNK
jgi:hypothetical protein